MESGSDSGHNFTALFLQGRKLERRGRIKPSAIFRGVASGGSSSRRVTHEPCLVVSQFLTHLLTKAVAFVDSMDTYSQCMIYFHPVDYVGIATWSDICCFE